MSNSDRQITAGISAESSYMRVGAIGGVKDSWGDREFLSKGGQYFEKASNGSQGGYGSRPRSEISPVSAMYELFDIPLESVQKDYDIKSNGANSLLLFKGEEMYTLTLQSFGKQTVISRIKGGTANTTTDIVVGSWIEKNGHRYPKSVQVSFAKDGEVFQTRDYVMVKELDDYSVFSWKWKESSLVKDRDDQQVYKVRNGKLVLDPRFSKGAAGALSWRHGLVFLCGLGFAAWAIWRVRTSAGLRSKAGPDLPE